LVFERGTSTDEDTKDVNPRDGKETTKFVFGFVRGFFCVFFCCVFFWRFFVLFFLVLPQAPTAYHPYWRDHLQKGWQRLLWERQEGEKKTTQKTNNTKKLYKKSLGEFVSWSVFTAHHQSLTGETTRRRDGVSTFHCYFFPSLLERPLAEGWEDMIGT
jgi:hypothetical protein